VLRSSRALAILAGAAGVAVVAGVLLITHGDLWAADHTDGWGPLGSYGTAGFGFDAGRAGPWSIGVPLCLAHGNEPAVLDGTIRPASQIGNRMRILGAVVRRGIPRNGFGVIGSVMGYPPGPPYDDSSAAKGFAVSTSCDPNNLSTAQSELDVGVAPEGTDGGGWDGLAVGYTVGWRHHVLTINSIVVVCGPSVPDDICAGPTRPS
jgi:hypothetical protein